MKLVESTPFSDFIRNATNEQKEAVYSEVMAKATERQLEAFKELRKLSQELGLYE
jgi:hypothetical protein